MTEREQPSSEQIEREALIGVTLDDLFGYIDECMQISGRPVFEILINSAIIPEEETKVYTYIINPSIANVEGRPEVIVINILDGLILMQQMVVNAVWEDGYPSFKDRKLLSIGKNGKRFDDLEIAETAKNIASDAVKELDIKNSAKIFPYNPNISNGLN